MSKRTRGTARTQHRRPGTRPTTGRSASRQREATERRRPVEETILLDEVVEAEAPGTSLTEEESAEIRSHPRTEGATSARASRAARANQRVKPGSLLAARAATEYVYVTQDLKRITVVGGLLFAALIVLWLLIVVLRVIPLPFY